MVANIVELVQVPVVVVANIVVEVPEKTRKKHCKQCTPCHYFSRRQLNCSGKSNRSDTDLGSKEPQHETAFYVASLGSVSSQMFSSKHKSDQFEE